MAVFEKQHGAEEDFCDFSVASCRSTHEKGRSRGVRGRWLPGRIGKLYQLRGNTSKKQGFDPRMADPADNDLSGTLLFGELEQDIGHLTMADNAQSLDALPIERLQYRIQHSLLSGFDFFFATQMPLFVFFGSVERIR
jgi:hypothetical protein